MIAPALGANVLDAAILAGAASAALYGDRGFVAIIVVIIMKKNVTFLCTLLKNDLNYSILSVY